MGGPRKPKAVTDMKKPMYKLDDIVNYQFLGAKRKGKITELKRNPQNPERWIYTLRDCDTNRLIPFVGIVDTEKYANILLEEI